MWQMSWHATTMPPVMHLLNGLTEVWCGGAYARMFREHEPDMIVSLHPLLTQPAVKLVSPQSGRVLRTERCCPPDCRSEAALRFANQAAWPTGQAGILAGRQATQSIVR